MMMRKVALTTGMVMVLATGVSYGFGIPKIPGLPSVPGVGGGGVSGDAVTQFIAIGKESSDAISKSREMLAAALATKEQRAEMMSKREQIQQGLNAQDKKAAEDQKAFVESQNAQIMAALSDQQTLDNLKSLSAEQQKAVTTSALNLVYGVIMQREQVVLGQSMITQVTSNPMLVTKLPAIKDTVTTMASNLSGTAGYLTNIPKLFAALGVSPKMPTSKDDKPAEAPADVADLFSEATEVAEAK